MGLKFLATLSLIVSIALSQSCCSLNTVSIIGTGTVKINPDTATISLTANANGNTSALALSNVNKEVNAILALITANGIPSGDYSTSSINISPNYDYSSGSAVLTGQSASQTLTVNVKNIDQNGTKVGNLITKFSTVNNITISGLSFSNNNQTAAKSLARKAAVADASTKYQQYLSLSGLTGAGISQIIDQNTDSFIPYSSDPNLFRLAQMTLNVPYGQVSVSASVEIIYLTS